jgi:hypothetical protein
LAAKKKRPSWIIRALKAAFADKPTKDTKVSRVKRKNPDYLYTAHQDEARRRSWLSKKNHGGRS